ncbi:MAG: DUF502 domain-containing protein [Candidatus Omnitrophota bacterium]
MKRYFITGLIVVVPVLITVYVLFVAFRFLDGILGRYLNVYFKEELGFYLPGIGLILLFVIVVMVGFLASRFLSKRILRGVERWFAGLPFIDRIYPLAKHIVLFILAEKEFVFKKVVLVEYPSKGLWSLGFLTNEEFSKINEACARSLVSVFIPSTPGPLTGYAVFVPREDLKFLDLTVSDALKIIISGGVVKPEDQLR